MRQPTWSLTAPLLLGAVVASTGLLLSMATPASAAAADIPVGDGPMSAAYSVDGTQVYVTNQYDDTVSIVDIASSAVTSTVSVGSDPFGVAANPDGTAVFVSSLTSGTVSVISSATGTVTATIPVGSYAHEIAFTPSGDFAFVTLQFSDQVAVIDTATNTVVGSIAVGSNPFGIAMSPDGTKLYVTDLASATVSVISTATRTRTATIAVGPDPFAVAFSPDGAKAYVTHLSGSIVSVIDTTTDTLNAATPTISIPGQGTDVEFAPSGEFAYVAATGSRAREIASATNTQTSRPSIVGGNGVIRLAISPDGTSVVLVNFIDDTISVRELPVPVVITSPAPPAGEVAAAYSFTLTAAGSPAPAFSVSSGALPAGLSLDAVSGLISGTPSGAGRTNVSITATNGIDAPVSASYTLVVNAVPSSIAPVTAADGPSAPAKLPATGFEATSAGLVAGAMILLGGMALVLRRSRRVLLR